MTLELIIAIASSLIASAALALAILGRKKQRKLVELIEFVGKQNENLEQSLAETGRADRQKLTEQARRIAWLESRIRKPKLFKEENVEAEVFVREKKLSEPLKSNITERRHRVLTLSSRGQTAEAIASTLGMMTGEVELILNLNRGSVSVV